MSAAEGAQVPGGEPSGPDAAAVAQAAFEVVGLYGDPTVSWSVVIDAELGMPVVPEQARGRLAALVAEHPSCGPSPAWRVVGPTDWSTALHDLADRPYSLDEPLVRAICALDGSRVALAAHHGVVDGLGLLALLAAALGTDLRSTARGLASAPADRPFLRTCVDRGVEAVWRSPRRFRADRRVREAGDWLAATQVHARIDTPRLAAATTAAMSRWAATAQGEGRHPVVLAVGASRRPAGERLVPDRRTAYLRIVGPTDELASTRHLLAQTAPEPDFPPSRAMGLAPLVTRLLQRRLGSTALVSNLGRLEERAVMTSVARLSFYPSASGPAGVATAAVTIGSVSTVSLRARRAAFSKGAVDRLLKLLVAELNRLDLS